MRSNYELNDAAGISTSLEKLVRHYPKPEYWDGLLTTLKQGDHPDPLTLGIYRLMLETGTLKRAQDYVEMGQLAIDAGVPGEAQSVVEAGFANKVLENADKARNERLLASAKKLVAEDRALWRSWTRKPVRPPAVRPMWRSGRPISAMASTTRRSRHSSVGSRRAACCDLKRPRSAWASPT
jgi:hypothetical protein